MYAIDTNIWIYCHDNRDQRKQIIAQKLVADTSPIALPWQVGCEFLAACRKLSGAGFQEEQAWQSLEAMQQMVHTVILPTTSVWTLTRMLKGRHSLSVWDALLAAACLDASVKTLFTEDLGDNSDIEGMLIVNPFRVIGKS